MGKGEGRGQHRNREVKLSPSYTVTPALSCFGKKNLRGSGCWTPVLVSTQHHVPACHPTLMVTGNPGGRGRGLCVCVTNTVANRQDEHISKSKHQSYLLP